ncbi:recombinase family protein [Salmonella enterica]|uniref:recombinase family protein n=1 Tax=Salmonella enterica TaxID=28901 RepID=UPI00398C48D3
MPAFEWVHVQLHQQKGMISLSPPTICNSARRIGFLSLQEQIETNSASGKLVFHVFAALAEFERNLISERTKAGLEAARARGRLGGRKPKLQKKDIREIRALLKDGSIPVSDVARRYGVSRTTIYNHVGVVSVQNSRGD